MEMLGHVSFGVNDLDRAAAFYDRILALRPQYGATYYAAFVIDLDGYKLEAVYQ